jgi:hypothetical protein
MWLYNEKNVDEDLLIDYTGFIYCITNIINGKQYIGKKLLKFKKIKQVKGKRKKYLVESDWREYYSSSDSLKADVDLLGREKFKREILKFCKTKGECNYWEAKYQFLYGVLESDMWYNGHIQVRVHKSHIKNK